MKINNESSTFSEIDSMGTNMMRFSFWLKSGHIPLTAIITGANNQMAEFLSQRECFNYLFLKNKNKLKSIDHICEDHKLEYDNILFLFDDILDLDVAQIAGLRFMIKNNSSPLLENYVRKNLLTDYISYNSGNSGAVREISELIIGLNNNYDTCINERRKFSTLYNNYLNIRNSIQTIILEDNSRDI